MQLIYDEYIEKTMYEEKFNKYKESVWLFLPNLNEYYRSEEIELKFKYMKEKPFDFIFYEERDIKIDKVEFPLLKDWVRLIENLNTKTPNLILKEEAENNYK